MAIFLVDKIIGKDIVGFTANIDKVMHNLQIIGTEYYKALLLELEMTDDKGTVQMCCCGRYIAYIQVSKDKRKGQMIFMDTRNDYDKALEMCNMFKQNMPPGDHIKVFMEEFEKMKPYYELNYNAAELLLESTPLN
jgi:hypothetical protein